MLFLFIPFQEIFTPPKASSIEEIRKIYEDGNRYVEFNLNDLHYTTYDYYSGGKDNASCYYYILDEDNGPSCVFFLIPAAFTDDRADTLKNYSAKAKFVSGGERFETFIQGFSTDIGWDSEDLLEISGHFVVSQTDYRPTLINVFIILILVILAVSLIYILANIVCIAAPHLHPACRRLKRFGLDGKDFTEIDRELSEKLLIHAGRLYVTENYLVALGKRNLWMIPLFNIVWAYKYSNWNPLVKKNKLSYSLIVITSPKDKVSIRGNRKVHTDRILKFLEDNYSHIVVGYTDEIREQMEELL
ncbi:MAG: hypothetical protein IKF90_18295 [Parasporobacterium sp.]|nr:hypothetical protein [Parasporobacterium sp.]